MSKLRIPALDENVDRQLWQQIIWARLTCIVEVKGWIRGRGTTGDGGTFYTYTPNEECLEKVRRWCGGDQ